MRRGLRERLRAAGVATRYPCFPGMVHGFLQMAGLVGEAQQAIDQIAAFLRDTTPGSRPSRAP